MDRNGNREEEQACISGIHLLSVFLLNYGCYFAYDGSSVNDSKFRFKSYHKYLWSVHVKFIMDANAGSSVGHQSRHNGTVKPVARAGNARVSRILGMIHE